METPTARPKIPNSRRVRGFAAVVLAAILLPTAARVGAPAAGASPSKPVRIDGAPRGRVDLYTPTFSNPTKITNPLFPISKLRQVIQLGREGDEKLKHEITLLPETKFIRWNGRRIETLVSQFVAYGDGRILETAVDFFAQDDRGAVWYFGEDVDNFVDGVLDDHKGTWLAGRDGPPGMIMPAHPRVGDVYRPENIPGLVFEEVTVNKVNQTVRGPRGLVPGALVVRERPADGAPEDKMFAPGYGEFLASVPAEGELVRVAVAHPTDRLGDATPKQLRTLAVGARNIFNEARYKRWTDLSATEARLTSAWEVYLGGHVPPLLRAQITGALEALDKALQAREVAGVRQAAIEVAHAAFDLQMQYRDPVDIDSNRIDVWKRQLFVDAAAEDSAGADSDLVIIEAIDDRSERGADD